MKIHFPTFFVWFSLAGFSVPTTAFSINNDKKGSNFTCPVGQVEWEVQLSNSYFQLSRAVRQSLMSIPELNLNYAEPVVYFVQTFC